MVLYCCLALNNSVIQSCWPRDGKEKAIKVKIAEKAFKIGLEKLSSENRRAHFQTRRIGGQTQT